MSERPWILEELKANIDYCCEIILPTECMRDAMSELIELQSHISSLTEERDAARIELCKKDAMRGETTWKEEATYRGWGYLHALDELAKMDELLDDSEQLENKDAQHNLLPNSRTRASYHWKDSQDSFWRDRARRRDADHEDLKAAHAAQISALQEVNAKVICERDEARREIAKRDDPIRPDWYADDRGWDCFEKKP